MVLQVFAHARPVGEHRHAKIGQARAITNPRQFQELRRLDRAGGQNHLSPSRDAAGLAALANMHRAGPPFVNFHPFGQGSGFNLEVRATFADRVEIGGFGAKPPAIFLSRLKIREAGLGGAIVIMVGRVTERAARLHHLVQ